MAKNKAAKITSRGTYVYKNSRYNEITDSMPSRENFDQYIYIPDISNLQTGVIDQMTTTTINGLKCYKIKETSGSISHLDFGDNEVTFMCCRRDQNGKILGVIDPELTSISSSMWTESGIPAFYRDGYGAGYPSLKYLEWSGPVRHAFQMFIPQWVIPPSRASYYNFTMTREQSVNRINGNNINFLNTKYDGENDCILIPASYGGINCQDLNGVTHSFDYDDIEFGYNLYKDSVGSFGIENSSYPNFIPSDNTNQFLISNPSSGVQALYYDVKANWPNTERGYTGTIKTNGNVYRLQCSFVDKNLVTLSHAFAYDSENDAVCLIYTGFNYLNGYIYTYLIPFSAMTISGSSPSEFNLNDFMKSLLGNIIDSDKVPKPDDELFNDNGPDIDGAGDPYNTDEFNNIGSSVGGDADPGKDLNSVDATPNTSFNNFMQATGFFGSYVVSNADLVEYTDTLKMLYSHADDVFFGEAAGLQADRITKNTIGLHMLPLTIPTDDYADTIFSMGNVGIAATDNYSDYKVGNNYAHANYLTKLTRTFNVPLGTIKHNYDNFLDFAPYSSASLYIPYIGKVQLPINLVQSTSSDSRPLRLEFRVDYTSGDFMAILFCNMKGVDVALSHWNGNCARPVKVSVDDDSSAIIAGANRIASMFSFGASGSIGAQTSRGAGDFSSSSDPVSHNSMDFKNHTEGINSSYHEGHSAGKSASASFRMPSMPSSVTTNQHMIGNGTATGELGYLGIQDIVLTVERPIWWKPYDYGNLVGYPTKKVAKLASVKGFARVSDAHIRCKATATEKNEIATLLSEGVIF